MQKTYIRSKFLYSQIAQESHDLANDSNLQDLNSTYRKGIDHYEHHLHTQFNVKMLNSDVNLKNELYLISKERNTGIKYKNYNLDIFLLLF